MFSFLVTRTGIGRSARRALVVGGSDSRLRLSFTTALFDSLFYCIQNKKADAYASAFFVLVTRTGIEPMIQP